MCRAADVWVHTAFLRLLLFPPCRLCGRCCGVWALAYWLSHLSGEWEDLNGYYVGLLSSYPDALLGQLLLSQSSSCSLFPRLILYFQTEMLMFWCLTPHGFPLSIAQRLFLLRSSSVLVLLETAFSFFVFITYASVPRFLHLHVWTHPFHRLKDWS